MVSLVTRGLTRNKVVVVIFSADGGVRSLANVNPQCTGETGKKGRSKHCHGGNAENTVVHASASHYCIVIIIVKLYIRLFLLCL